MIAELSLLASHLLLENGVGCTVGAMQKRIGPWASLAILQLCWVDFVAAVVANRQRSRCLARVPLGRELVEDVAHIAVVLGCQVELEFARGKQT